MKILFIFGVYFVEGGFWDLFRTDNVFDEIPKTTETTTTKSTAKTQPSVSTTSQPTVSGTICEKAWVGGCYPKNLVIESYRVGVTITCGHILEYTVYTVYLGLRT